MPPRIQGRMRITRTVFRRTCTSVIRGRAADMNLTGNRHEPD